MALRHSFCLLNEESCLHIFFNTDTKQIPCQENFMDKEKALVTRQNVVLFVVQDCMRVAETCLWT